VHAVLIEQKDFNRRQKRDKAAVDACVCVEYRLLNLDLEIFSNRTLHVSQTCTSMMHPHVDFTTGELHSLFQLFYSWLFTDDFHSGIPVNPPVFDSGQPKDLRPKDEHL